MMWSHDKKVSKVSVEINDQEIYMLWYTKEFSKNLTSAIFQSIPLTPGIVEQGIVKNPSELSQILENSRQSQGINTKVEAQITISVPNGFIREYDLPWVPKRERQNLIRYLADEEIPILPEERIDDAWIEEEIPERLRVILCGIRKDIITALLMSFEAAGFYVSSMGFSTLAWANALALEAKTNTLFIKKFTNQYQFIFYHGNVPQLTKMLFVENDKDELIPSYHEEIIKILDYYYRPFQEPESIQRVILSSEPESAQLGQFVCKYIKERQEEKPQLQNVTEVISMLYGQRLENDRYLGVIGRTLEKSSFINNFLRDRIRSKIKSQKQLITVVMVLVLSLTGLGLSYHLEEKIEEVSAEVNELKVNQEELANAEVLEASRIQELSALGQERSSVGADMRVLLGLSGNGLEFSRIKYQADQITMDGLALEATLVQKLLNDLKEIGYTEPSLQSYHLEYITSPQGQKDKKHLKFSLKADRKDSRT